MAPSINLRRDRPDCDRRPIRFSETEWALSRREAIQTRRWSARFGVAGRLPMQLAGDDAGRDFLQQHHDGPPAVTTSHPCAWGAYFLVLGDRA